MSGGGGCCQTVVVPELERAMQEYIPRYKPWTAEEEGIMDVYYNRVDITLLMKQLGRTKGSIQDKAGSMGITNRGRK
jgi:hypothetical protein